jgi:two-component system, OmpR family, sensor histidine kinase PhoQ
MRSLRLRLIVAGAVVLAVSSAATYAALNRAFHASALSAQEEKMKGLVYSILGAIDVGADGNLVFNELTVSDQRLLTKGSGLEALVISPDGKVVWQSPSVTDLGSFPREQVQTGDWLFEAADRFSLGFGVVWLIGKGESSRFTIYVAEDRSQYLAQLRVYHRTLAHWLGVAAILILTLLIALLHWVSLPLQKMAGELAEIQAGTREGVGGNYPTELKPLGDGLNSLLRHERGQQKRYRNALDDLAHSLKTPLAAMRAVGDPRFSEPIEQITKTLDYQVRRASTAGRTIFTQAIRPRELVDRIASALTKVYREKSVRFEIEIDPSVAVPFDEGDLMEVFGNLLDNGAKWCKERVTVSGRRDGDRFVVVVEDDGPGFPKEKREELLKRGVRADRRVPGEGIGLAVVADIVALYEGELTLGESSRGGGQVSLSFPV